MSIKDQEYCPYGHKDIDHVNLAHHYVYCYECKKRYVQEDYDDGDE